MLLIWVTTRHSVSIFFLFKDFLIMKNKYTNLTSKSSYYKHFLSTLYFEMPLILKSFIMNINCVNSKNYIHHIRYIYIVYYMIKMWEPQIGFFKKHKWMCMSHGAAAGLCSCILALKLADIFLETWWKIRYNFWKYVKIQNFLYLYIFLIWLRAEKVNLLLNYVFLYEN